MSIQAIAWVLENSTAELGARLVLLSIANHADRLGHNAYPSYETIGIEARMDRRNAIAAVQRLERDGHITVRRKASRLGTNVYTILGMASDVSSPPTPVASDAAGDVHDTLLVMPASPEPSLNRLTAEDDEKSKAKAEEAKEQIRQITAALAAKQSVQ